MKVIAFLFIILFAVSSEKLLQSDVVYAVNCASTAYTTKSGIKYEAVIILYNKIEHLLMSNLLHIRNWHEC